MQGDTQILYKVAKASTIFYMTRGVCWLHRLPEDMIKELVEGCKVILEHVDDLPEPGDMYTAVMVEFLAINCELILDYLEAKDHIAEKWEQFCDRTGTPGWLVGPRTELLRSN